MPSQILFSEKNGAARKCFGPFYFVTAYSKLLGFRNMQEKLEK